LGVREKAELISWFVLSITSLRTLLINMMKHIKRAFLSLAGRDDSDFPTSQVEYNGKVADTEVLYPYGLYGNAPAGSLLVMMHINGEEENRTAIASYPQIRFMNLKEGEVAVGNPMTKSVTAFRANGDIETVSTNGEKVTIAADSTTTVAGGKSVTVGIDYNLTIVGILRLLLGGITIGTPEGGAIDIDGTGSILNLKGSYRLGGTGGQPIARVGDTVRVGGVDGVITSGSGAHTAT
jgi:phage gp45-like